MEGGREGGREENLVERAHWKRLVEEASLTTDWTCYYVIIFELCMPVLNHAAAVTGILTRQFHYLGNMISKTLYHTIYRCIVQIIMILSIYLSMWHE